jgi:DNA polymerase III subunit delta
MIIFIYGEDNFRSKRELQKEVNLFNEKTLNGRIRTIDADEEKFSLLNNESGSFSLFKEKLFFVIKNIFNNKEFEKEFLDNGERFSKSGDVFVVYYGDKVAKNGVLYKFLQKNADCREFLPLEGMEINSYVSRRFKEKGFDVDNFFINSFVQHNGRDLWRIENEMEKICNFRKGEKIEITDIKNLGEEQFENDIFKTIDAIARKDKKKALELVRKHIKGGAEPIYLLSMITYQFRNILIARDLYDRGENSFVMQNTLKVHPFVAKKSFQLASKFSLSDLTKIYSKIFRVDFSIKTGKIEPVSALDLLIIEI